VTKAQIDLAHRLIGDLGHCAKAADQYVNARLASTMRNAASLLQVMVDEYEAVEPTTMGGIDRSPSAVWQNAVREHDDG
jgi:hypothetical protein